MPATPQQRWTSQVLHSARGAQRRIESGGAIEMASRLLLSFFLLFLAVSAVTSPLVATRPVRRRP
jgi:hypothetical protein